ncbi:glycine zipper 2TM domain-containing protein [Sphingobium nicotianae]|uniref:17 kDa surface antigen n=1 Tax=Sphingobium nicotianae TaxID=2782607 RepID=A0A9X1DFL5_9SPHN|nr:glycine zipper 2TM domain-containing protein [Sphingobium nicotianae]MBT2188974.1 glycine zipper 2TM domain-containing protein [Sphingobium nicotianae]
MTAKTIISLTAAATMVATSLGVAAPASARDHYNGYRDYRGDYSRDYRYEDRGYRDYRDYRGRDYRDNRYAYQDRYRCRNDGAAGTIIGAIAGGLIGNSVAGRHGDKTAGVIIGGAVGAVAGRAIDKGGSRC